ncbi:MAG: hypothetical protein K0S76_2440 [Herbinix sp.]|nr:hypothetical protein [Herbinix sp.]
MRDKIERLSKGIFEYELPFICLTEEEILFTVEAGKIWEGCFTITNSAGRHMKGVLYSSSRWLTFQNQTFQGIENVTQYQFNAQNLLEGEYIRGEITIVSDCGEQLLPFCVQIEAPYYLSSLGKMKDLYQFTNLARMDWTDAKKVFRSEDFERIFLNNEEKYQLIYRNLRKSISTSQALEEFLIAIHKKSTIRLSIDKTRLEYLVGAGEIVDKVTLTKDHWGYAEIKVSTDAAFLQLEQKYVWADHFIGNSQQIGFTINPKNMKKGVNYGKIYIKTVHQTLFVEVICRTRRETEYTPSLKKQRQRIEFGLFDNYLNFRLNRIHLEQYIKDSEDLLKQLPAAKGDRLETFVRIHLAVISGNKQTAEKMLSDLAKEEMALQKESAVDYCTYIYLNALYRKDEETIKAATETIRHFYENGYFDWRILWFLLYTDTRYEKNKGIKLQDIKEQFYYGCHSPMLYYEAVCIYNEEPYQLRELGDFEIQILNFGIRNWIISKDTAQQYSYLTNKKKTFHPMLYHGLVKLYDEYQTTEILSSICCMLIKGLKKSPKYFEWFSLGVKAQLRITELYEYYIYSIKETYKEPLADQVLLYFIYNSNLNDRKKSYLYANIIINKNKNEAFYRSYQKKMEVFAMKQLEAHHISADLAVLYREFLVNNAISPETLSHLPYVIYKHELECENRNMVGVTVIHRELEAEENQVLTDGRALVDIYTSNAEIFLIDSTGNRYAVSAEYRLQSFLSPDEFEKLLADHCNHPMVLLNLFDRYQNYRIINEKAMRIRKKVLAIEGLKENYYTSDLNTLIDYYYENYDHDLLEGYLRQVEMKKVNPEDRKKLLEYMIIRSFYDKAMEAFEEYGYELVALNRLVKLCSAWINLHKKNTKLLLHLCHYVFKMGKYDDAILKYLVKYYYGSTNEMFHIWQAAKGFDLPTHRLEERLLIQILFAESYVQDSFIIFSEYYKEVTNHQLVRAFLSYNAYKYLVHDRVIHNELFPIMKRELNYDENDVCLLAYMKHNIDNKALSENDLKFIEYNIYLLVKKGIVLPLYKKYAKIFKLPEKIEEKCYAEYKTDPQKRVYIHYRLLRDNTTEEFVTEPMQNSFLGIHVKEFILFYHEILQYYITEEFAEDSTVTESLQLQCNHEITEEEETTYNQINLMLLSLEMKDEKTLLDMMEHYVRSQYMMSKCFLPLDELR